MRSCSLICLVVGFNFCLRGLIFFDCFGVCVLSQAITSNFNAAVLFAFNFVSLFI